jgi:hypothetical protein
MDRPVRPTVSVRGGGIRSAVRPAVCLSRRQEDLADRQDPREDLDSRMGC